MSKEELPSKDTNETLGFCVNCDATRVISRHGKCINCGSESIYRNGVAKQLEAAKIKYEESKRVIISKYDRFIKEYKGGR